MTHPPMMFPKVTGKRLKQDQARKDFPRRRLVFYLLFDRQVNYPSELWPIKI